MLFAPLQNMNQCFMTVIIMCETFSAIIPPFINSIEIIGFILSITGFLIFVIGACQIYYSKLTKKGAVLGGLYKYIRHPQYTSFIVCSFGLLLLWPRYIVIFFFVTLVFGYYFLARAEEAECERKFGETYIEYERNTGRFFPKTGKLLCLTNSERKMSIGKVLLTYIITLGVFYAAAFGLNQLTLRSLYSTSDASGVTVSLCELDSETMENVITIAKNDENVRSYLLTEDAPAVSDILTKTTGINPLVEVWVDVNEGKVIDIKEIPETVKYDGIPEAIY